MDVPMRAACEPSLDPRCLVGGVVVHHQVHVRPVRYGRIDLFEEVEKLARTVAFVAFADHSPD